MGRRRRKGWQNHREKSKQKEGIGVILEEYSTDDGIGIING
jgi:hypothetical protein